MTNTTTMNSNATNNTINNAKATMSSGKEAVMTTMITSAPMSARKALCDEIRRLSEDKAEQWIRWTFSTPWKVQSNGVSLIYKGYGFAFDNAYTHLGIRWQGSDWVVTPVPADEPVHATETTTSEPPAWAQKVVGTIAGTAAGLKDKFVYERELFNEAKDIARSTYKYSELTQNIKTTNEEVKVNAKLTAYHTKEAVKAGGRTIKAAGLLCGFGINRLITESIDIADTMNNMRENDR